MSTQTVTVYINKERSIYVDENKVDPANLENVLYSKISNEQGASIVLRADKTAPVQDIVVVIDAVNEINNKNQTKHKVILATKPNR
jgi:biopolymer transport protein ExbD